MHYRATSKMQFAKIIACTQGFLIMFTGYRFRIFFSIVFCGLYRVLATPMLIPIYDILRDVCSKRARYKLSHLSP
jgi:hypothetical protein